MELLKNILWATDFSNESKTALRYAHYLSGMFGARLTALHVVPDFSPLLYELSSEHQPEMLGKVENTKATGHKKVEQLCESEGVSPAAIIVKEGPAATIIIETSREVKADLIVVGRKGATGSEKSPIGSVAHKLLRTSSIPVLITKGTGPKPDIKKIIVPTDFVESEEVERDYAWKLARRLGASLTFLYVFELFGHDLRLTDELFAEALKKLKARRKREHIDVGISEKVTRAFNAAEGIIDAAEHDSFDLIVMSSVVKKLPRMFLGSTTEKVILHSSLPVLAIPPRFE